MPTDLLQESYKYICAHRYTFILHCDTPQPHLRLGWDKIIYPEENDNPVHTDVPISARGIAERHHLLNQAISLGLPKYLRKSITNDQLRRFIQHQGTEKYIETDENDLNSIIGSGMRSRESLLASFRLAIKKYLHTESDIDHNKIDMMGTMLLDGGYVTKNELKFMLEKYGVI
jgi:hypothetical protein